MADVGRSNIFCFFSILSCESSQFNGDDYNMPFGENWHCSALGVRNDTISFPAIDFNDEIATGEEPLDGYGQGSLLLIGIHFGE